MCCSYGIVIIGVSSLMHLHVTTVKGFIIPRPTTVTSYKIARTLGMSTIDEYDGEALGSSMVAAASAASAWHETSLPDSQYSDDDMIAEMNDQFELFEEKELQELCVIAKSFDIDEAATKRRSMRHHPKKYKHLFRYSPDISVACWLATVTNLELLESCGFTKGEFERMSLEFPRLLKMDAKNAIAPKLRFLVNVLGGGSGDIGNGVAGDVSDEEEFVPHNLKVSEYARKRLPFKKFFNSRLETAIGPRHAYLALHKETLPYGKELLDCITTGTESAKQVLLLDQFLDYCSKKPVDFANLCNQWQSQNIAKRDGAHVPVSHTAETIMAMDNAFSDGLVMFSRNEVTPDIQTLGCTPAEMVSLLLAHGANYAEHDDWGSTVLHWTAGTGNLDGIKTLVKKLERDEEDMAGDVRDVLWSRCASCYSTKDMATPLHWAAVGVNHTHFGCGGHVGVCRFLLDKAGDKKLSLSNSITSQGNTPFMWACWSGSLDVAKLLVNEGGADAFVSNERGFNAAHWAASAGHLDVCKFLQELGMSFVGKDVENEEGLTPLDNAKYYGRSNVVDWVSKQTLGP